MLGLVPIAIGALGAALAPTPDLLITGDGRHLAVVDHGVPYILRDRTGDYVQSLLAEASGYDSDPELIEDQLASDCSRDACVALLRRGSVEWRLLATRSAYRIDWEAITNACASADIVVSDRRLPKACQPRWLRLDSSTLARTGGLAIYLGKTPWIDSVAERVGEHPWRETAAQ